MVASSVIRSTVTKVHLFLHRLYLAMEGPPPGLPGETIEGLTMQMAMQRNHFKSEMDNINSKLNEILDKMSHHDVKVENL